MRMEIGAETTPGADAENTSDCCTFEENDTIDLRALHSITWRSVELRHLSELLEVSTMTGDLNCRSY